MDRARNLKLLNEKEDSNAPGVTFQRETEEMTVTPSSKPNLATKKMEMAYFTQNTIADALIDLSQSSNIVSSVKDGTGDHHLYRDGNP